MFFGCDFLHVGAIRDDAVLNGRGAGRSKRVQPCGPTSRVLTSVQQHEKSGQPI